MSNKEVKNYGLIVEPLADEDWRFGSSGLGGDIIKPDGNWNDDVPDGEVQRRNDVDKMSCVTGSALNCLETEFNYRLKKGLICQANINWLKEKGYIINDKLNFAERFTAKLSNTGHNGNSLKAVGDTIRKLGLIPESVLPYTKDMTWDEYYSGITNEMMSLGREFLNHFKINYEAVSVNQHDEALKYNPIQVAIHAYNGTDNSADGIVYVKTNNGINHAVEKTKPAPKYDNIFDTYEQGGSFIKQLASDFIYMSYGYRYIITEIVTDLPINEPIMKNKTTRAGYFAKDIQKILIPEGTELTNEEMFDWIPYLTKEQLENEVKSELEKERTVAELISMILNKIFKK